MLDQIFHSINGKAIDYNVFYTFVPSVLRQVKPKYSETLLNLCTPLTWKIKFIKNINMHLFDISKLMWLFVWLRNFHKIYIIYLTHKFEYIILYYRYYFHNFTLLVRSKFYNYDRWSRIYTLVLLLTMSCSATDPCVWK